jgi:hypothetical protein
MRSFKFFIGFSDDNDLFYYPQLNLEEQLSLFLDNEISESIDDEILNEISRDIEAMALQVDIEREYNLRMIA